MALALTLLMSPVKSPVISRSKSDKVKEISSKSEPLTTREVAGREVLEKKLGQQCLSQIDELGASLLREDI